MGILSAYDYLTQFLPLTTDHKDRVHQESLNARDRLRKAMETAPEDRA